MLCLGDWWIKCVLRNAAMFLSSFLLLMRLRTGLSLNFFAASNNNKILIHYKCKIHPGILKGCYWADITVWAPIKVYVRIYHLGCSWIHAPGMLGSLWLITLLSWLLPAPTCLVNEIWKSCTDTAAKGPSETQVINGVTFTGDWQRKTEALIEGCASDKRHKCRWRALIKAILNNFQSAFQL